MPLYFSLLDDLVTECSRYDDMSIDNSCYSLWSGSEESFLGRNKTSQELPELNPLLESKEGCFLMGPPVASSDWESSSFLVLSFVGLLSRRLESSELSLELSSPGSTICQDGMPVDDGEGNWERPSRRLLIPAISLRTSCSSRDEEAERDDWNCNSRMISRSSTTLSFSFVIESSKRS